MDLNVKGRIAFVTGASRGIGRAIATALAAEGVNIALFGRDIPRCHDVAEELRTRFSGVRTAVIAFDLAERSAINVNGGRTRGI